MLTELLRLSGIASSASVADALLDEFGSLRRVINANQLRLRRHADEATCAAIAFYRDAVLHTLRPEPGRPIFHSIESLKPYLTFDLADRGLEEFRVFYLDFTLALILEETAAFGSVSECTPYIRAIIKRAIEVGAAGLILVHNHPSGIATPSEADLKMTRKLANTARELDIRVLDHLIIANGGSFSWQANGLL